MSAQGGGITVSPIDQKPFRSEEEPGEPEANIRMALPRVRANVVPAASKTGDLTKDDFVTSFLVSWRPVSTPPAHLVELLRDAPFGTRSIRARDLHWDGRFLSIELLSESDIEAFSVEMPDWVAFANAEFGRREHTPAEEALAGGAEARRGASEAAPGLKARSCSSGRPVGTTKTPGAGSSAARTRASGVIRAICAAVNVGKMSPR
jgi:hypothetical protein